MNKLNPGHLLPYPDQHDDFRIPDRYLLESLSRRKLENSHINIGDVNSPDAAMTIAAVNNFDSNERVEQLSTSQGSETHSGPKSLSIPTTISAHRSIPRLFLL